MKISATADNTQYGIICGKQASIAIIAYISKAYHIIH